MDNSTNQQNPAETDFSAAESTAEQTGAGQMETMISIRQADGLNGTELFSLFTADIIREKVLFTR